MEQGRKVLLHQDQQMWRPFRETDVHTLQTSEMSYIVNRVQEALCKYRLEKNDALDSLCFLNLFIYSL